MSTRGDPLVCCGGKGANQAVACARLVDDTLEIAFYGRVGSDTAGEVLVKELQRANVDISGVRRVAGGSGQGFVLLEDGGTVLSLVNKGANHGWDLEGATTPGRPRSSRTRASCCCSARFLKELTRS